MSKKTEAKVKSLDGEVFRRYRGNKWHSCVAGSNTCIGTCGSPVPSSNLPGSRIKVPRSHTCKKCLKRIDEAAAAEKELQSDIKVVEDHINAMPMEELLAKAVKPFPDGEAPGVSYGGIDFVVDEKHGYSMETGESYCPETERLKKKLKMSIQSEDDATIDKITLDSSIPPLVVPGSIHLSKESYDLPVLSGPNEFTGINYSITAQDEGGFKVVVEGVEYFSSECLRNGNTCTIKRRSEIDHETISELKDEIEAGKIALEDALAERDVYRTAHGEIQAGYKKQRDRVVELNEQLDDSSLMGAIEAKDEEIKELKSLATERLEEIGALAKELVELRAATAGHSIENIATIMKAAPLAEDLEGHEFEYRNPEDGEERFRTGHWYRSGAILEPRLIRVPIVEWIENDDITDKMVVKAGGRVPCQVKDFEHEDWNDDTLYEVEMNGYHSFICKADEWKHCRIKKSDLEVSV